MRVSIIGGGTDFPNYYEKYGGCFISFAINKYIYLNCKKLTPFYKFKYRFSYSKVEELNDLKLLNHPVIKSIYRSNLLKIPKYYSMIYSTDYPTNSGLGSSSAFCASLLKSLYFFNNKKVSKDFLFKKTLELERVVLKEYGGVQDQFATIFGGFNYVKLKKSKYFVSSFNTEIKFYKHFLNNIFLIFHDKFRFSSLIEKDKILQLDNKKKIYDEIKSLTNEFYINLQNQNYSFKFGELINEYWNLKCKLSKNVESKKLNELIKNLNVNGANGVKLLGSGKSGFLFCYSEKSNHKRFINYLNVNNIFYEKPEIDHFGTRLLNEY